MKFEDIPAGSIIFLDTNTFVYAFNSDPNFGPACNQLLERIDNQELHAVTSAHVVAEMAHRLMALEAARLLGRSPTGLANWLKRHPAEVQRLARSRQAIDELTLFGVQVLPVTGPQISRTSDISHQYGLLTNNAWVVVVMRDHGLMLLASHDADFDRVPNITRYAPL